MAFMALIVCLGSGSRLVADDLVGERPADRNPHGVQLSGGQLDSTAPPPPSAPGTASPPTTSELLELIQKQQQQIDALTKTSHFRWYATDAYRSHNVQRAEA